MSYHNVDNNQILLEWVSRLEQRTRERNILGDLQALLRTCKSRESLFSSVELAMADLLPHYFGYLAFKNETDEKLRIVHSWGNRPKLPKEISADHCVAVKNCDYVYQSGVTKEPACAHCVSVQHTGESLCVPLAIDHQCYGILFLQKEHPAEPNTELSKETLLENRIPLLSGVGEKIAMALKNLEGQAYAYPITTDQSYPDLVDRQFILKTLKKAIAHARPKGKPVGLIVVNIRFEPAEGKPFESLIMDRITRDLGIRLAKNIRRTDTMARIGENSFGVVVENASQEVTQRIISRLEIEFEIPRYNDLPFSTSMESVCFQANEENDPALLEATLERLIRNL